MTPSDGARARTLLAQATEEDEAFLLQFAREAPALYGTWRYLKGLYKDAETGGTPAVLGTLIGRLDSLDAGDLRASQDASRLDLTGALTVAVAAPYACATQWNGYRLLDLSQPGVPRLLYKERSGRVKRAAFGEGRLYLELEGGHGVADRVAILDLANPERPAEVGAVEIRSLRGMAVLGQYLVVVEAVGSERGRLRVFDVSTPASPEAVANLNLKDVSAMAVSHGRAYVASGAGQSRTPGLHVVDLRDPRNPVVQGFFPVNASGVFVNGDYLEIARRGRKVWILDPTVPPPAIAEPPPPPAAEERTGLIQRVTNFFTRTAAEIAAEPPPALAHRVYELTYDSRIHSSAMRGDHLYIARQWSGIEVVSLAGATRVAEVSTSESVLLAVVGEHLYALPQYNPWQVFDLSTPGSPALLGVPPRARTLAYMKRRARRLLRKMQGDPNRFAETAYHALRESGSGRAQLDLEEQWVSVDLLYGGSGRFEQTRHGRGSYVERRPRPRVLRRTREERRPEAWDRRLDLARALFAEPDLPWQVHETMLKVLLSNRAELPPLTPALALRFLRSASPVLISRAVQVVIPELEAGQKVEGEIAARAYFYANGRLRRTLAPKLATRSGSPGWARPFAATLTGLVAESVGAGVFSGRVASAAGLLNRSFSPFIAGDRLLAVADRLVEAGRPELLQLLVAGFRSTTLSTLRQWLELWGRLPEAARMPAWEALASGLKRGKVSYRQALDLITDSSDAVREGGWRVLQILSPEPRLLAQLWEVLLSTITETPALRTAVGSAAALELLARSGLSFERLAERLTTLPSLAAVLSPETMEVVARTVPVEGIFPLIAAIPEDRWLTIRGAVLDGLRTSGRLGAFWKAVPGVLGQPVLEQRLLEDPAFIASLLTVDDIAVLDITDPPFEALLHEWAVSHPALLSRGSAGLLTAATHPLPQVRDWALERVRTEGFDLPFALRLLESTVPGAMALARTLFDAAAPGSPEEQLYALALSDSPESAVRAVGREYIRSRWASLSHDDLLRALAEHGDAEMNRYLAELLVREPAETARQSAEVRDFDRGVLRARNRGRRAKEQVKQRLTRTGTPDVSLLLDVARSGTPRDSEWALGELARLAATGTAVDGVTTEGVAGV